MSVKGLPWSEDAATGNVYRTVASPHDYDFVAEAPDDDDRKLIVRAVNCHDQLVAALEGLTPILEAAESNASGNPEWTWISPRINAARAALAAAKVPQ